MAAYSGKEGSVLAGSSDLAELLSWELEYGSENHSYASRHGAGALETVEGVEGGSGTITLNVDTFDPISGQLGSGNLVTLQLRQYSTTKYWTGQARMGKHRYTDNLSGEPQRVVVPFVTHGAWTAPT
jgi:hypothetical protein